MLVIVVVIVCAVPRHHCRVTTALPADVISDVIISDVIIVCAVPRHHCRVTTAQPADVISDVIISDVISSDDRYRVELLETMLGSYLCKKRLYHHHHHHHHHHYSSSYMIYVRNSSSVEARWTTQQSS